jgi:flagellar biosynthesis protein FlhB
MKMVSLMSLPVLFAVVITALVTQMAQTGFIFTAEQMKPSLKKINPISGIKKWFAIKSLVELMKSLVKILVTFYVGWTVWHGSMHAVMITPTLDAYGLMRVAGEILWEMIWKVLLLYIFIGGVDVVFQRWQMTRDLKMSKKELKDEYKNQEGDPYMKAKRRQVHQQIAQQASAEHVPQGDVVVMDGRGASFQAMGGGPMDEEEPPQNAVVLKYDQEQCAVPWVIAKGEQRQAEKIHEAAIAAGVPVVRDAELAVALCQECEIGDLVPAELFRPVAQILAYIFVARDRSADAAADASAPAPQPALPAHEAVPA